MKPTQAASTERLRAAAYVRMSTERQVYSTANQLDRIREYAASHELDLVTIYEDSGRSGLTKKGRPGLIRMIEDVQGEHDFTVILVYDISRWGRFQDLDESAHYEYLCRVNGVNVAYCAEVFENDGSPFSAIIKALKRAAAAEYSRELSIKVFAGQCRMISMGFKTGGPPGYGLRRALLDTDGRIIQILKHGEWKTVQTQRVVLVPGPPDEIAIVNQVFAWYLEGRVGDRKIAAVLNAKSVPTEAGGPWTADIIRGMLQNEKYIGNLIFNKASFKLRKTAVRNPPEEWVRCNGAITPIVPREIFEAVARERNRRHRRYSDEELLASMRRIYGAHGRISSALIDADPNMPNARHISRHFGTLFDACAMAGVPAVKNNNFLLTRRQNYELRDQMVLDAERLACEAGATTERCAAPHTLRINGQVTVSFRVIRCAHDLKYGYRRWYIRSSLADGCDFLLVALLDRSNRAITSYLLLASAELGRRAVAFTELSISRYAANQREALAEFFLPK
jgi:DNA invertase Pin-like site-specific DNA recombinase